MFLDGNKVQIKIKMEYLITSVILSIIKNIEKIINAGGMWRKVNSKT